MAAAANQFCQMGGLRKKIEPVGAHIIGQPTQTTLAPLEFKHASTQANLNFAMPKHTSATKTNVKAARAEKRGAEAIQEAIRKMELQAEDAPEFFSVQKPLGNGRFVIRGADGKEWQGVGGHGGGKARISVGQIVLAAHSATPALAREILAVIGTASRRRRW